MVNIKLTSRERMPITGCNEEAITKMATVKKTIVVPAPIREVYNQWTQFETFPEFMEGVKEVRQLDDRRLHWRAEVAGKEEEWDAEITEQVPDTRIAWRSISGRPNAGVVDFHRLDDN